MTPIESFSAAAAPWQNFYLLVGTAAATLIGLMFVAVTFGAGRITSQTTAAARAFIDPPFAHFVTVLFAASSMLVPPMRATFLGTALIAVTAMRALTLVGVARRMVEAHARYHDLELSDWLLGIAVPALCYVGLVVSGAGFILGRSLAFSGLAAIVLAMLLVGIFGAWELIIWLATAPVRGKEGG